MQERTIRLRHVEFQHLDCIKILHAAPNALGDIKQHIWLGGVGITQDAHADTVNHQIAAAEIAESYAENTRRNVWHVFVFSDREPHQSWRHVSCRSWLPDIFILVVFKFADLALRIAAHHEAAFGAVTRPHRIDQINQLIGWCSGGKSSSNAGC